MICGEPQFLNALKVVDGTNSSSAFIYQQEALITSSRDKDWYAEDTHYWLRRPVFLSRRLYGPTMRPNRTPH